MEVVPIVLFVFNRPDHLTRVLGQLRVNNIQKLYVFCDGPRDDQDNEGVNAVRRIVNNIDWVDKTIYESSSNKGLSSSIISGLNRLFKVHDRLIIIEDDIVISPGFYEYMCGALERYHDESDIVGVTGTSYPIGSKVLDQFPYDTYFQKRFSSWGWGTWRRAWEEFEFNTVAIGPAYEKIKDRIASEAGYDMTIMAEQALSGELEGSWDVIIGINMLINNWYFVWPKINYVENDGIGTGTHAGEKPSWTLVWGEHKGDEFRYAPVGYVDLDLNKKFIHFFRERKPSRGKNLIKRIGNKLLRDIGIERHYHTDNYIAANIKKFVATIEPKKIASIVRPENYASSVEILIPCYNHAPYLEEAFASIERQTVIPRNLVVTFINDASTDGSLLIMKKIQSKSKQIKVRIINNEKNLNQVGSLNKAVMTSTSQLFINLNADDLLTPDCIELTLATYKNNPDIFLLGGSSSWFVTGEPLPLHTITPARDLDLVKYGPSDALRFNSLSSINMSQSSCSFFRPAWELVGGYFERQARVCSFDDRDFQMRICALLPIGVYKEYPMQFYRRDSSQARATI